MIKAFDTNSASAQMENTKIVVRFFQRRPRKGFSFSLEYIFEDLRRRLNAKIISKVLFSKCYNDGLLTKLVNIAQATFRQGKDVNHITGEVHFLNLLMNKEKVLLTILDCGMVERKKGLSKKLITWLYLTGPVKKAKIVTAISEHTKNEIVTYTKCNPDKIKIIPVAVSSLYQPDPKHFNESCPNILHIGTGYNKNLSRLIKALNGIKCHLTIIGKLSKEDINALHDNEVEYTNEHDISDKRLFQKYKECDILAFISTFEGFGMPIIEANAVERVVITSNLSSMPEVAGEAACLVNPYNIEEIKNNILKIITDSGYRQNLIEKGRINKMRFDGDRIAASYYSLYSSIALGRT